MSRVSIEIDGVKWGLNISPEHTIDLIQALNAVVVQAKRGSVTAPDAVEARNNARDAFGRIITEITFAARKSA